MKYSSCILTPFLLVLVSMFASCTSTSEPEVLSDLVINTEYNPIIIPYYLFEDEGLEIPQSGSMYHILNSSEEAYSLPSSEVFSLLQKEIYNNFDFSNSSIILISVLGEIHGPAPHCAISYSYNDDKSATIVTVKWKEGIKPIEDVTNPDKERAVIIQFAIGVGKISSNTPIIINQVFS